MADTEPQVLNTQALELLNKLVPPGYIESLSNEDLETYIAQLREYHIPLPQEVTRQTLRSYVLQAKISQVAETLQGTIGQNTPIEGYIRALHYSIQELTKDERTYYEKNIAFRRALVQKWMATQHHNRLYLLQEPELTKVTEAIIKNLPRNALENGAAFEAAMAEGIQQATGGKLREIGLSATGEGTERINQIRQRLRPLVGDNEELEELATHVALVSSERPSPQVAQEEERLGTIAWTRSAPFPSQDTEQSRAEVLLALNKVEGDTAIVEYAEQKLRRAQRTNGAPDSDPEIGVRAAFHFLEQNPSLARNPPQLLDTAEQFGGDGGKTFWYADSLIQGEAVRPSSPLPGSQPTGQIDLQRAAAMTTLGGLLYQRPHKTNEQLVQAKQGMQELAMESTALNEALRRFHEVDIHKALDTAIAGGVSTDFFTGLKEYVQKTASPIDQRAGAGTIGKALSDTLNAVATSPTTSVQEQTWTAAGTFHSLSSLFEPGKKPAFLQSFFTKTGIPVPKTMEERMMFMAFISRDPHNFSVKELNALLSNAQYYKDFISAAIEKGHLTHLQYSSDGKLIGGKFSQLFRDQISTILYHIDISYLMITNPGAVEHFKLQQSLAAQGSQASSFLLSFGGQVAQGAMKKAFVSGALSVTTRFGLKSATSLLTGLATGGSSWLISAAAGFLGGGLSVIKNLLFGKSEDNQNKNSGCLTWGIIAGAFIFVFVSGAIIISKDSVIPIGVGGGEAGIDNGPFSPTIDCTQNPSNPECVYSKCDPSLGSCDWPTHGCIYQGPDTFSSHRGLSAIDISKNNKQPVYATHDGTITESFFGILDDSGKWGVGGYGNFVTIRGTVTTKYGHLRNIKVVNVGQTVKKGDLIGYVDHTGWSSGPHLHYERIGGDINQLLPFAIPACVSFEQCASLLANQGKPSCF